MTGADHLQFFPKRARRRSAVAWVGLALLSINILAGALLPSPGLSKALDVGRDTYVVCSMAGMVEFDQNGTPIDNAGDSSRICVFCLPLNHVGADVPPSFVLAEAHLLAKGALSPPADINADDKLLLSGASGPRAPPLV